MNLQNLQQKKLYVINGLNHTNYGEEDEKSAIVIFETKVIKSNLCDYSEHIFL